MKPNSVLLNVVGEKQDHLIWTQSYTAEADILLFKNKKYILNDQDGW